MAPVGKEDGTSDNVSIAPEGELEGKEDGTSDCELIAPEGELDGSRAELGFVVGNVDVDKS